MSDSCDPMDCSLPGSSVHGILLARILEWFVISFSKGSSQPRTWTLVSCITGRFFTSWAMRILTEHFLQGWTTADKLPLIFSLGNLNFTFIFAGYFIRYRILGWQFSPFSTYICHLTACWPPWLWKEISLYSFWGSLVCDELLLMCYFQDLLFVSVFCKFGMMCLVRISLYLSCLEFVELHGCVGLCPLISPLIF